MCKQTDCKKDAEKRMHNIKKNTRHELICMDVSDNITSAG